MTSPHARTPRAGILIRHLRTHDDYHACLALQREVWGSDFHDCVGPALLKVSQRIGGLAVGAFEGEELVGFVFGLRGVMEGVAVHWSHMLAVAPRARGAGIGRQLKRFQREAVESEGLKLMVWTFDPLVARNAHLNLNVLGAEVAEYVESMYSPTESKLHGSLPTDRLVVRWNLDEPAAGVPESGAGPAPASTGAGRTAAAVGGDGAAYTADWRAADGAGSAAVQSHIEEIRILVPADFEQLLQTSPSQARDARTRTRDFFRTFLGDGWRVAGFRLPPGEAPYYLLRRDDR